MFLVTNIKILGSVHSAMVHSLISGDPSSLLGGSIGTIGITPIAFNTRTIAHIVLQNPLHSIELEIRGKI